MLDQKRCTDPTGPRMQKCGSFFSNQVANQKRQTQTISLSELLISSVFLYVSSGVFCVRCTNNPEPETLNQKPRTKNP